MVSLPSQAVTSTSDEIFALFFAHLWILMSYHFLLRKKIIVEKKFIRKIIILIISYLKIGYQHFEVDSFIPEKRLHIWDKVWRDHHVCRPEIINISFITVRGNIKRAQKCSILVVHRLRPEFHVLRFSIHKFLQFFHLGLSAREQSD